MPDSITMAVRRVNPLDATTGTIIATIFAGVCSIIYALDKIVARQHTADMAFMREQLESVQDRLCECERRWADLGLPVRTKPPEAK